MNLPKAEVERCFVEPSFDPPLAAMELHWDPDAEGACIRTWRLPDGVTIQGSAPHRFGIAIHRCGEDSYRVRLMWNRLTMNWDKLTRTQIMTGSLAMLLSAIGTDLWVLLDQPTNSLTNAA